MGLKYFVTNHQRHLLSTYNELTSRYFRVLVENGVKLSLTVIDTPGFGEAVDNTECWAPILEYVEDRFDAYLEAETRVERVDIRDNR